VKIARSGGARTLVVAFAFGMSAQGALAGQPGCRVIESTSGRLACYDAAFPPKAKQPLVQGDAPSRAGYRDPLVVEDARTAAKLKSICRGC